jgi:ABC-type antimicrobial peptide transport system permease subunit
VLSEGFLLVIGGVGLGLVVAGVSAYSMQALLFGVTPSDLTSYVAAVLVFGATGLAASWWPARRAMRVNPVHALRAE